MAAPGRPTRLDEVYEHDPRTGNPVTVADAIVRYIRGGNYLETSCHLVGVDPTTVRGWLADGARAHHARLGGRLPSRMRKYERLAWQFSIAARTALAESEARDLQLLSRLALGGIPQTTTTVKTAARTRADGSIVRDANGDPIQDEIERTVRTTTTLPDRQAIQWRLERRFPERWGRHDRIDIDIDTSDDGDLQTGPDPLDAIDQALTALHRRKTEALAQLEAAGVSDVIDVDVIDEPDRPPDPGDQPL